MENPINSIRVREAQEELSRLNSLLKHPGFIDLLKIAEEQVNARTQSIFLTPLKRMDEALEQEFKKGEISGIKLFSNIVQIQITNLNEEIEETLKELEENKRTSRKTRTDDDVDADDDYDSQINEASYEDFSDID